MKTSTKRTWSGYAGFLSHIACNAFIGTHTEPVPGTPNCICERQTHSWNAKEVSECQPARLNAKVVSERQTFADIYDLLIP